MGTIAQNFEGGIRLPAEDVLSELMDRTFEYLGFATPGIAEKQQETPLAPPLTYFRGYASSIISQGRERRPAVGKNWISID
jgi:hypothetical protein